MISVVIATRDRAALLASTLAAVSAQEWPGCPFEIVVVDNASTDATPDVIRAAAAHSTVPIVSLREAKSGKSHALNAGVAAARGDLLVLTDDDVVPDPGWLAAYVRAFAETGADYAAGRILPLWEAPPPAWMSPALYGVLAVSDGGTARLPLGKRLNEQVMPIGANMAVWRYVTHRVGGWEPSLGKLQGTLRTGEDHDFAERVVAAGFSGVYEPAAAVRHRVPADRLRLAYFRRWFHDNGVIVAGLEELYPTTSRYLFAVPKYLWRQAAFDVLTTLRGLFTGDRRRIAAGIMRLVWFAGFARARWASRRGNRLDARAAAPAARRS